MADNVTLNAGTGGSVISTDDIGAGIQVQRVKAQYGPDGSATDVNYGGAGLPVGGDYLEVTGTATGTTNVIAATDVRPFSFVSVQLTGTFSATVTWEQSNNNTTWQAVALTATNSVTSTPSGTAFATGVYQGMVRGRYFRVRVSSYTSGTVNATAEFTSAPASAHVQPVYIGGGTALAVTGALAANYSTTTPVLPAYQSSGGSIIDASSARTTSGSGASWTQSTKGALWQVEVTAVSGTSPTLTCRLQTSLDNINWVDLDTANAQTVTITGTGVYRLYAYPGAVNIANLSCNLPLQWHTRMAWTIGGTTPSFTFLTRAQPFN